MPRPNFKSLLAPYWDVLIFVFCLLGANLLWKVLPVDEDDFPVMASWTAQTCTQFIGLFRDTVHMVSPNLIIFDSGFAMRIVGSCTPVKQSFIFLIIMLFARGYSRREWLHKLWFIPTGWVLIEVINLLRITSIGLLCELHPERFVMYHEYVFKYLFYGLIFLIWVLWTESPSLHAQHREGAVLTV